MAINVELLRDRRLLQRDKEHNPPRRTRWDQVINAYNQLAFALREHGLDFLPGITIAQQEEEANRDHNMAAWLTYRFRSYAMEEQAAGRPTEAGYARAAAERLREINAMAADLIPGSGARADRVAERDPNGIGYILTQLRLQRGLSLADVMDRTGYQTKTVMQNLELDRYPNYFLPTVARYIVDGLGLTSWSDDSRSVLVHLLRQTDMQPAQGNPPSEEEVLRTLQQLTTNPQLLVDGELNFGRYLKFVREQRKLTASYVCSLLGSLPSNFSNQEAGRKPISLIGFLDWMNALGLNSTSLEAHVAWSIAMAQESKRGRERV